MKKIAIVFALSLAAFLPQKSIAQVKVSFNVDAQPLWGPVGYDHANYYYLPGINSYYNVSNKQFIYQDNGKWTFSNISPAQYKGYDLYNGYKVVMNTQKPYLNYNNDKVKYAKYKTAQSQPVIKYSKDPKYKTIHTNVNGVPAGQAKKIVVGSNQKVVLAGSNGQKATAQKVTVKTKGDNGKSHEGKGKSHEGKGKH